eukprot:scaffold91542_cov48-Attheya_sp.AAC.2
MSQRRTFTDAIPNQEKNKRRPTNSGVTTRARKDKRLKSTSASATENQTATGGVRKRGCLVKSTTSMIQDQTVDHPIGLSSSAAERKRIADKIRPGKKKAESRTQRTKIQRTLELMI